MSNTSHSMLSRLWNLWPLFGLVLAAILIAKGFFSDGEVTPYAQAARHQLSEPPPNGCNVAYRPIEQIRVGQRVITDVPDGVLDIDGQPFDRSLREGATRVDPATWRLIRMRAEEVWPDGTVDDINIETLQPLDWIEAHNVRVGGKSPIPVDLVEMGLPADLEASVSSIAQCNALEEGPGRMVLTTINHLSQAVMELTIRPTQLRDVIVRPTSTHRFYRAPANLNRNLERARCRRKPRWEFYS